MTYFVAEIELDEGHSDYKVFSKYKDASLRHSAAIKYIQEGKPVGNQSHKQRYIHRPRLWRVDTESVEQAAACAKSHDATLRDDWYLKEGPLSLDDLLDY